ncbi:MAG TPA: multicopper oxidase domain-containing protein [Microthrixaceae bacterium]|nr:multicopper oxidase domain-containing protein [Microthrixaceae bacterium]
MSSPNVPIPTTERRSPVLLVVGMSLVYLLGIGGIIAGVLVAGGDGKGSSSAAAASSTVEITLSEFSITGNLTVPAGKVVLNVSNKGTVEHNLTFVSSGKATKNLGAGTTQTLDLGELKPGSYEIECSIAGHKDAGMKATLTVTEAGAAADSATETTEADHVMTDAEAMAIDDKMMAQMKTFATDAVKTEGAGNTPLEPTIGADGAKEFTVTAEVTKWEVEPGKIVDAWTYNGQVPGPWIKVNLGDKVRLKVVNKLQLSTDLHLHGIHTPNSFDGVSPYTQQMITPGTDFTYEFLADEPAVGMYHAHMHGEEAVPNGMFGVFQIGDVPLPAGRTVSGVKIPNDVKIVQEIPMVLNDAGTIGFSLNGKSFPSTAPVVVNKDDWFEVHYFNEGLQNHPMHMHGFPQLIIAKDGIPLDQPYWADTILIGPGERYTVLVQATDLGTWVWHCHILNHVEMKDRLFGMATAVVVQDPTAA